MAIKTSLPPDGSPYHLFSISY